MKIVKIISSIIYFLFTFIVGIILALYLPNIYAINETMDLMESYLNNGEFAEAMTMGGGLYDEEYVLHAEFTNGGGIVLFNSASLIPDMVKVGEEETLVDDAKIHKAYSGFVYGVKSIYNINSNNDNKTKIVVTDLLGETHDIEIINYDSDGDKIDNTIYTYEEKGYFYVDIGLETLPSIAKIEFIDKDGNLFAEIETNLEYDAQFFTDVEPFVNEYNNDFNSSNLKLLKNEFMEKSEHYRQTGIKLQSSHADKKAAVVVVVYFIVVYIIADFLLGSRFIIKFVKWILVKVFKVKFKQRTPKHNEVFGHDYFCKLTLSIDTESVENFDESVQLRFQNQEGEEFSYILIKSRNYTDTQSIKAGNYVNLWVDLNEKYKTQNLPDTMEVEGYQKTITFKILNRED